tara:strand:- start:306 stop:587 length:282 start_codon:yes stop_codon:yes gene_type:complete
MNVNNSKLEVSEMDFYMYESICSSWFGNLKNVRNIIIPKNITEDEVIKKAKESSKILTGSTKCDINLLQKYHMMIYPLKSFSSLTKIEFHNNN